MMPSKIVESHIVQAKNSTPVKQHYIELSPKRKSKRQFDHKDDGQKIETQNSRSFVQSQHSQKQNNPLNFQVVNIIVRNEKPFQKIPKFKNQQVVIRNRTKNILDSENKSKRKKITVTKLLNEGVSSGIKHPQPFQGQENVANEQF